jgi:PAS domain S-box-containing protein
VTTPLKVLIVEDSELDAELMVRELKRGDFEPQWTRVENAAQLAPELEKDWDIILADYNLPGFDALRALAMVKENGRDVPFLIVSGSIGEEIAVQAMHAGAADYIMKGNPQRLAPAVRRELREAVSRFKRRQAELALIESEERYRTLVEHTSDLMIMARADGRILFASPSTERILGLKPESIVGTSGLDLVHPEDRTQLAEVLQRALEGSVGTPAFRCRHRDGSWRVIELMSTAPTTHEGQPAIFGAARDVTERRALEEQLRQSQKMEAVGRLAGGVAHDFNNFLTIITGYAELIRDRTKHDPEMREEVDEIRKAAERAANLTRDLLAFSRRQVMAPRVLNLNEIVRGMQGLLRPVIREDIVMNLRLAPELGRIRADPNQLELVIMNLVVNARDAMRPGGTIKIETANAEVPNASPRQHPSVPPGSYVQLAVSDTGHGMDEKTKAHIFEPFFTTKEKGKGTGLGLPMAYGIVQQSEGHITLESEPGRGTTFRIFLPRVEAPVEEPVPAGTAAPPRGVETVLLVEDEDPVRALAREVLEKNGYRVLEAQDATAALALRSTTGDIDLLVTDMVMPGPSGRELAERLTEMQPGLRVLFISGYTGDGISRSGQLGPGTSFLQKPFTPDTLVRKVREVLGSTPPHPTPHRA